MGNQTFAAGKLPHYKIPRVMVVDDFPMTVTGKLEMCAESTRGLGLG